MAPADVRGGVGLGLLSSVEEGILRHMLDVHGLAVLVYIPLSTALGCCLGMVTRHLKVAMVPMLVEAGVRLDLILLVHGRRVQATVLTPAGVGFGVDLELARLTDIARRVALERSAVVVAHLRRLIT